jgi:hypothetical protein
MPFLAGRTILTLSTALMTFEAEVGGEHPEVNKWAMDRYRELVTDLNAWRRVWWVPRLKRRRRALAANGLARLTDVLTKWSTGSLSDAEVVATRFAQGRAVPPARLRLRTGSNKILKGARFA